LRDRRQDFDFVSEAAGEVAQKRDIASALCAETKILADQEPPRLEPLRQDLLDESLRRQRRERAVEALNVGARHAVRASSSSFSRSDVRRVGAACGEKNSRGWGSKVRTQACSPRERAPASRRCSIAWWPRWMPSKFPTVSATGGSGAAEAPWVSNMEGKEMA
jgi:hypothetical protein